MKTRRNRRGGGPFFGSLFGTAQPAPAQTAPVASQVDVQNAVPLGEKELPEALLKEPPAENPSGNATVDKAVADLYDLKPEFQNYHMRGIINAIGVCNSTEKARNNLTGTFEAIQCGPACKVRSEKVKASLKELLRIGEGNDALGYIGSGRVAVNSAGYLGNSAASLGNKLYNTGAYLGNSVSNRLFTPRAPAQPTSVAPSQQNALGASMAGTAGMSGGKRTRRRR